MPFETVLLAPALSGHEFVSDDQPEYHIETPAGGGMWSGVSAVTAASVMKRWGVTHNQEFTMLEWYRPHYDMYRLMNEVDDLLQQVLECSGSRNALLSAGFPAPSGNRSAIGGQNQLREVAAKLDLQQRGGYRRDRDTLLQLYSPSA